MLEIARHLARLAQGPAYRHMQDALTELEDALSDHLVAIETAADDDKADAEDPVRLNKNAEPTTR